LDYKHHQTRGKRIGRTGMALSKPPSPYVPATETFMPLDKPPSSLALC
jgi:hypothetical protein